MKPESTLFSKLPEDAADILNSYDELIQNTLPLNSRQLYQVPENIRTLSHLLTDDRPSRRMGYMNEAAALSAYIRYFMWWNLVRLTPLFAGLSFSLKDGDVCLDCGSGPLTVPVALWLACPELRKKKLTWYCLDYSQTALSHGEDLFMATAARTAATTPNQQIWQIIRVKGPVGTEIKKKASFISCANMFNELFWNAEQPLEQLVKKYAAQLLAYAESSASVLLIEPGVPRAARFVSLFRDSLIRKGFSVLAPCPHEGICPMDGRKGGKWCHFVLETDKAPARLKKLSAAAGIPKDRASLSFVYASRTTDKADVKSDHQNIRLRIVSDAISLYNKTTGRYSCSEKGLSLAIAPEKELVSGDLVCVECPKRLETDRKSGAVKIQL